MLVINNQLLLLKLPLLFIFWWFVQAPGGLLVFLFRYFIHFSQVLSVPLLIKTFFVPWKNENRKGYVGIARGIGIVVKSCVLFADLIMLLIFFLMEMSLLVLWMILPLISVYLLMAAIFT